ncbi:MAG: hypothetical protein ACI4JA_04190, partial [Oscillospiraceae bacterium]
ELIFSVTSAGRARHPSAIAADNKPAMSFFILISPSLDYTRDLAYIYIIHLIADYFNIKLKQINRTKLKQIN